MSFIATLRRDSKVQVRREELENVYRMGQQSQRSVAPTSTLPRPRPPSPPSGIGTKISEAYENVTGAFINITWENFHIESPRNSGMYIDVYEEDTVCSQPSQHKPADWLTAHNLTYRNVYGEGA
jgi:hypothetical protein